MERIAPSLDRNYLRVRGEYIGVVIIGAIVVELPPRARRIRCGRNVSPKFTGTTSACAENTIPRPSVMDHEGNYLRVRGEYPK